jgi:hypothetical protein
MIFGLAEGVPSVGLSYDSYYDQKLGGALASFGLARNVARLDSPEAKNLVDDLALERIAPPATRIERVDVVRAFRSFMQTHVPPPTGAPSGVS